MNFQLVWAAIQPILTQLLASPQFQAVLQKIIADIGTKIAAGVHPTTAVQNGLGQMGAAAALHLTGNPIADIQALLTQHKTPTGGSNLPPATGTFTS